MKKYYFISDIHLGLYPIEKSREREKKLVRWLDEIKNQIADVEKNIQSQLKNVEREVKKESLTTVVVFAGSYILAGLVLSISSTTYSKPFWFGWGLIILGVLVAIKNYIGWRSLSRKG